MARRSKDKKSLKVNSKSRRNVMCRSRNEKRPEGDPNDLSWLPRSQIRMYAARVLNKIRERPYWLSIPHGQHDGTPPVAGYFPCSSYRTKDRVYYGFLFKEHRDALCEEWMDARKELTEVAR